MNMSTDPKRMVTSDDLDISKLCKLLRMTTSNVDGEAIAAMRLANAMLKRLDIDWEILLRSKITIVNDPFASIPAAPAAGAAPPRPRPPPQQPKPPLRYPRDPTLVNNYLDTLDFIPLSTGDNARISTIRNAWTQHHALTDADYDFLCRTAQPFVSKKRKRRI